MNTDKRRCSRLVVALCGALWLVTGCTTSEESDGVSSDRCTALRDHAADLALKSRNTGNLSEAELQKHRRALSAGLGTRFVEDCERNMTRAQVACALGAESREALRSCQRTFASASRGGGVR